MSLAQFQQATALLIRLPEHNRGLKLAEFLDGFNLDETERRQLSAMAGDRNVVKYGRSMSGVRFETVLEQFRASRNFVSDETLGSIFYEMFESEAVRIRQGRLAAAFFDFLLVDERARLLLSQTAPPFAVDFLKFERAQLRFKPGAPWAAPTPGSRLAHAKFVILDLEWDVPNFLLAMSEAGPEPRAVKVLFTPDEQEPGACRYFEIDSAIARFLEGERAGLSSASLPEFFGDLVGIGLCEAAQ